MSISSAVRLGLQEGLPRHNALRELNSYGMNKANDIAMLEKLTITSTRYDIPIQAPTSRRRRR
jgi:hypothetical protein